MAKLDLALPRLLKWEGGYSNDPVDPGGETNFGITQRAWEADRIKWISPPPLSVKDITVTHAGLFYLWAYWVPMGCAKINSQDVASVLFSTAVNQGTGRAVKRMQALVGVKTDGQMGPATIEAINVRPGSPLCNMFCDMTAIYYDALIARRPSLAKFKRGWNNRINDYRVKV